MKNIRIIEKISYKMPIDFLNLELRDKIEAGWVIRNDKKQKVFICYKTCNC